MNLIFTKISPLEYALLKNEIECMIIIDNPELMELLEKCFQFERHERPTAESIFNMNFF